MMILPKVYVRVIWRLVEILVSIATGVYEKMHHMIGSIYRHVQVRIAHAMLVFARPVQNTLRTTSLCAALVGGHPAHCVCDA